MYLYSLSYCSWLFCCEQYMPASVLFTPLPVAWLANCIMMCAMQVPFSGQTTGLRKGASLHLLRWQMFHCHSIHACFISGPGGHISSLCTHCVLGMWCASHDRFQMASSVAADTHMCPAVRTHMRWAVAPLQCCSVRICLD